MDLSKTCSPFDTIERKLAERNVLIIESNVLKDLRLSKDNSILERKLAKEYYDYLDYKVLTCDKEIYTVFYDKIPIDAHDRAEILDKIECEDVQLWTYKSVLKVLQNPIPMDIEAYKSLSYREKVERQIAQHNILDAGISNIIVRRSSKKITEYESELLKAREFELKGLILTCIHEIWNLDWEPQDDEIHQRIKAMKINQARYDSIYNSMKIIRGKKHV